MHTPYAAVTYLVRGPTLAPRRVPPRACEGWGARGPSGDPVEVVGVRAGPLAAVQAAQRRHGRLVELEVEDREVLLHALPLDRLREDDVATLHVPPQGHLGG